MDVRFWMDDPNALLDSRYIRDVWPERSMTFERKLNAITRTIVTITLVGASLVRRRTTSIVASGVAAVVALAVLHYVKKGHAVGGSEGMMNFFGGPEEEEEEEDRRDRRTEGEASQTGGGPKICKEQGFEGTKDCGDCGEMSREQESAKPNQRRPPPCSGETQSVYEKNPFHNVLVPEYGTAAVERPRPDESQFQKIYEAVKSNAVEIFHNEDEIEDGEIKSKLFQSLGDNYTFEHSMRNYVTNPSISVAGNQDAFANFCYGGMCSMKEVGIHPS